MDVAQFWQIIDKARSESDGNWEDMHRPLVNILSNLDVAELMLWKQIFDEYQRLSYKNKLWAAAYVINGGCSDDGFDYFRAWLTAQGKDVFMGALADPDSLAEVDACEEDVEFEDMLSVATYAYFEKMNITNRDYDRFYAELDNHPLSDQIKADMRSGITYADDIDVDWDEDGDLSALLPKLGKAFEY